MNDEGSHQPDSWQPPAAATSSGAPYPTQSDIPTPPDDADTPEKFEPESSSADSSDDEALLRWQAAEYIDHQRTTGWYIAVAVVCVILVIAAIILMKSWTFAILIPVMAAALVVYTKRPPAVVDYTLSRKGLYVNDHLHPYDSFRGFNVTAQAGHNVVNLIPRKRFQMAQSVYFPEEVGEPLVDMLAARMPMHDAQVDFFDRITRRLRM